MKTLFDFEDPSKLVKSLLTLSLEELVTLANDPMGSYTIEAFLKSRSVPSENKHMLIENLEVNLFFDSCIENDLKQFSL